MPLRLVIPFLILLGLGCGATTSTQPAHSAPGDEPQATSPDAPPLQLEFRPIVRDAPRYVGSSRDADHFIAGPLRVSIPHEGDVSIASGFDQPAESAARCGEGWVFATSDGALARADTFTGPLTTLPPVHPVRDYEGRPATRIKLVASESSLIVVGAWRLLRLDCQSFELEDLGVSAVTDVALAGERPVAMTPIDALVRQDDGSWRRLGLDPRGLTLTATGAGVDIRSERHAILVDRDGQATPATEVPIVERLAHDVSRARQAGPQYFPPERIGMELVGGGWVGHTGTGEPVIHSPTGVETPISLPYPRAARWGEMNILYSGDDIVRIEFDDDGHAQTTPLGTLKSGTVHRLGEFPTVIVLEGEVCDALCAYNVETGAHRPLPLSESPYHALQVRDGWLLDQQEDGCVRVPIDGSAADIQALPEPFSDARHLLLGAGGRVYFIERDTNSILVFDGEVHRTQLDGRPEFLRWRGPGDVLAAGRTTSHLWRTSDSGRHWERLGDSPTNAFFAWARAKSIDDCPGEECRLGNWVVTPSPRAQSLHPLITVDEHGPIRLSHQRLVCRDAGDGGPWLSALQYVHSIDWGRRTAVRWKGTDATGLYAAQGRGPSGGQRGCLLRARTRTHAVLACASEGQAIPTTLNDEPPGTLYLIGPRGPARELTSIRLTVPPKLLLLPDGTTVAEVTPPGHMAASFYAAWDPSGRELGRWFAELAYPASQTSPAWVDGAPGIFLRHPNRHEGAVYFLDATRPLHPIDLGDGVAFCETPSSMEVNHFRIFSARWSSSHPGAIGLYGLNRSLGTEQFEQQGNSNSTCIRSISDSGPLDVLTASGTTLGALYVRGQALGLVSCQPE